MRSKLAPIHIILACALWASDLLVRYPITLKLSYSNIVLIESLLGLIFLIPWLIKNGYSELKKYSRFDWLNAAFLGGVGMTLAGMLFTYCIQKATPGMFSFFQIFQPLIVVFLAHKFLKEKFDNLYFFWGIWVIFSALLMYSQDIELALIGGDLYSYPLETAIALGVMIIWSLCTISAKKLLEKHSELSVVSLRWFFALIFALLIKTNDTNSMDWNLVFEAENLFRFIYISLIAGLVSMYFYYHGLKAMEASKASFIELTYPALGLIFSAIYTFDGITFLQSLGFITFIGFIILMTSGRKLLPKFNSTKSILRI